MTPQEADSLERNYYREQQLARREGEREQRAQQVLAEREARKQQATDERFYNKAQREIEHPKKVKPVESPELVQAKEQRKLMAVADRTRKLELEQFDQASAHEVEFDKKTGDVIGGALANRQAELAQVASKKVGLWDGMMSDTLESGQLTPEAQKAQGELEGINSQIEARRQQRERLKAEHDRTAMAKRDADINYGRQVMGQAGILHPEVEAAGLTAPAVPETVASAMIAAEDAGIDPEAVPEVSLWRRAVQDIPLALLKGVVGLGEAAVGIADIATLGAAGKAMEQIGYKPAEAKAIIDTWQTEALQAAKAKVAAADGFMPTIGAMVENPSTIVDSVAESAPSMLGGAAVGRVAVKLAPAALGRVAGLLSKTGVKVTPTMVAAGLGEGAITSGQQAEQTRQETGDLSLGQAGLAVAGGVGTAVIGAAGNKAAKAMGLGDLDEMLVTGQITKAKHGLLKRVVGGAFSEGVLEELPQSAQEQVAQNLATGKPWNEGVAEAAAAGMLVGGVMGGGGNVLTGGKPAAPTTPPASTPAPAGPTAPPAPAAVTPDDGSTPAMDEELAAELGATNQPLSQEPTVGGAAAPTANPSEQKPVSAGATPEPAVTSPEAQTTTADRPAAAGGAVAPEVPTQLTREAEALIKNIEKGGTPKVTLKGLVRIAKENGVTTTDRMTQDDLVSAIRAKKATAPLSDVPAAQASADKPISAPSQAAQPASPLAPSSASPNDGAPAAQSGEVVVPPASQPERIAATAVRDPKTGKITSGNKIHLQLYEEAGIDFMKLDSAGIDAASGFMTNTGRFVTQAEAQKIAEAADQVDGNMPISGEVVRDRISKAKPTSQPPVASSDKPQKSPAKTPAPAPAAGQVSTPEEVAQHYTEFAPDMAKQVAAGNAKKLHGFINDDGRELPELLYPNNSVSRKVFTKITGVKLPSSIAESKKTYAEFKSRKSAPAGLASSESTRPADVAKNTDKADTSPAKPVVAESAPTAPAAPIIARGQNKPAAFAAKLAKAVGLKASDKGAKFLADLSSRLHKAASADFEQMEVHALTQAEWSSHPELSKATPDSRAAYDARTNTLYVNTEKSAGRKIIEAVVHEAGHFAERFALSEELVQAEWAKLAITQRIAAWEEYLGRKLSPQEVRDFGHGIDNARARSEWVAFQFARVIKGDTASMSKQLLVRLTKWLADVRSLVGKWAVGSSAVSSAALDARIIAMMFPKGKRVGFAENPNGMDLLDWIYELGGVPKPPANTAGKGEWDGWKGAFSSGRGRLLQNNVGRTGAIDSFVEELSEISGLRFASTDAFYAAVPAAWEARDRQKVSSESQERQAKFYDAALENKGRSATERVGEPVQISTLGDGDTFSVKGEQFTVTGIGDEAPFNVSAKGDKTGAVELPGDATLYPDAGTFKKAEQGTATYDDPFATTPAVKPGENLDMFNGGETGGDTTFNLQGETGTDFTGVMDAQAQAKADKAAAEAAQGNLFDAGQPAEGKPAAKPASTAPKISEASKQKLRDKFKDLLGAPAEKLEQASFPKGKASQLIDVAESLIEDGIKTPAELAAVMDEQLGQSSRKFAQAFWDVFGIVDNTLRGTHDWDSIYSAIDKPAADEVKADAPAPVASVKQQMRDIITSDANRSDKARQMKKLADAQGVTLKEMQERIEAELVVMLKEFNSSFPVKTKRQLFDYAMELYSKQPLFSARTSTSIENQAYSTPAPLAAALFNMTEGRFKRLYEPTGGTGMLMFGANLSDSHANELNDTRVKALKDLRVGTVTQENAMTFVPKGKFDVVHANPPFGSIDNVNYDGFGIRKLEHLISLKALEAMDSNGSGALILGANFETGNTSRGAQWVFENYLYSRYHVTGNFEVSGDLYAGQGAKWPVRILVVAGRRAVPLIGELAPKSVDRLDNWNDVWERSQQIRNETESVRKTLGAGQSPGAIDRPQAGTSPAANAGGVSPANGRPDRPSNGGGQRAGGGVGKPATSGQPAGGGKAMAPTGNAQKPTVSGSTATKPSVTGEQSSPVEGAGASSGNPAANVAGGTEGAGKRNDARKLPADAVAVNAGQITFVPRSGGVPFETLTPREIGRGTHAALDKLADRVGSIDTFVSEKLQMPEDELRTVMSADQIDGVALAIDQIENGGALIIGDETGIGKGRQAAAIMRYAIKNGKVPVFFTLDPKLFSDMYADLGDINTKVRPLIFGDSDRASIVNPKSEEREVLVAAPDSKQQKAIVEKVTENGLSAEGYDAVFATYSQVNSRNHRQLYLERLAKDENVIVILDEAHNAAGQSDGSMQAAFMQGGEITRGKGAMRTITRVPGLLNSTGTQKGRGGVAYLSATYAKRPDNMPLYFRTDMRKATEKFSDLVKAMAKGGVALQQVVSEALASVGQYIRRERDFTGTSYIMKRVEVADLSGLVKQVDGVTDILQQIVKFSKKVKAAVDEMGEGQSTAMSDTQHSVTDFASVVHNQISQLLLAAKADEIVNEAVSAAKRGEKPVITMMNTMESFLSGYIEDNQIKVGQEIELSWKELMKYALSRTMRVTVKQPNGDTQINTLTPAQLGLESQFEAIIEAIGETNIKFPVSPIDYIIQRLRGEGIVVGELTGRESGIQYVDFEKGTGTYKRFKKADKNSLVNNFNGGKIDGLLLNASGSTGLSIHASPKFKDTKPRHMIIAQPALDINVFMQTIGRIKRTGMLPGSARYTHLTLPLQAELRPAAVANRKMKSLNANTTAESEGMVKIDSTDLINKYGDHIIAQYLADDYGLQSDLGLDIEVKEDGVAKAEEDLAKKFMGRLALLPDGEQARIYGDIIPAYNDYIEQLRATNEYDLDVAVHDDWDGTLGQETVLKDGTDETSIFTASVRAQKWEITDNRPIPTGEQMRREFEKNTGGKEKLDKDWADFKQTVNSRMMANIAKAEAALAKEQANPIEVGKAVSVMIAQNNVNQARITLEKWERTSLMVSQTINLAGRAVTLEDTNVREVWQGALIGVKFPDISGNSLRVSPSRFQFRYLLDTPGGRMYISGSQLTDGSMQQGRAIQSIDDFKGRDKSARYQRWVITGNPIAGYRATGGAGKMTRFKARDGSVITGLLMRNNWDPEKLAEDPRFQLVNGKAAANFLVSQPMRGAFWNLTGGDGAEIQITRKWNGGYQIITPSSAKGRDVFLDDQLRGVVGDFTKSGSKMNADLSSDKATIAKVVDRIVSITGRPMQAHGTTTQIRAAVEKANKEASGLLGAPAEAEELSPPKNAPVPGSPGSRYRSHTDTLIERGIAAARLEYRTLSDVDTVAAAKAFIAQSGEAAAAEAVFDDKLDVPAKVKTAIGAMIEIQLDARSHDASLSAEERRTAARQFARLAERMAYRGTSLGQAVQGYNLVNRLSPAGVILSAQEAAKTRQDKAIGPEGEKALKEIKEAMDKANAEKIDEATEAMNDAFRALRIGKSIWKRYQDMAARRWLKRIEANLSITTEKSPLSEFVNRLVSEVGKRIDKALPPGEKPAPLPALSIIAEAVNNREKYAEAWEAARKVIADKFEGQPDILEKLDDELMGVLDKPYSQKTLDRALKEALANLKTTVREVAKMHFKQADALGATLAERIAAESGLKPEQAEALAAEVSKRLAELTQEAKQKVLSKIGASKTGLARRMAGEVEKIIKLSNAGAFERAELMDLLAKELNLPKLTAEQAKRLRDLAEKAQSMPEGFQRDRVDTDIMAELKKIEGVGKLDIATAVYYAHILSGYTTQMVNAVSTTLNTLADIGILVAQNPKTAGQALVGIRDGASLGFTHAMSILSGGYAPRYFDEKLAEASSTLEILSKGEANTKGEKAIKAYSTALRYVGRSMKAADAVFFHSASEAFQRIAAAKLATAAGVMDRAELNRKVRDLLKMSPADFDAAMAQAKAEGLTGLDFQLRTAEISRQKRESGLEIDGTRFGREATFNNTPRGYLGLIAKSIGQASEKFPPLKLFVPFTNIVSNVTNASLNYTPLGAARAKFGYGLEGKPSAEERSTLLIKSIAGSMGMVALLALGMGDDDEKKRPLITANGPKDFAARRQLMETGWRPHSMRIGDTYVSYLVSPAALAAAMVGNWIDAVKYNGVAEKDMGERFAKAVGGVGETITNMSFLQGLADLMDTLRGKKSPSDFAAGVVVGATVPNLVRQVDRTLSPELREGAGFVGRIQSQLPGVRQALPERQNVIAKPIESVPIERFGKQAKGDPLWDTIAKKQAWITEPSKTTKLGNETMTAEQYRRYVSESGPAIERRLRAALPSIDAMTDEKANDFVDKVAREERKKAKARMGNGRAFSALFDE